MDAIKVFEYIGDDYSSNDNSCLYLIGDNNFKVYIGHFSLTPEKTFYYQRQIDGGWLSGVTKKTVTSSDYIDVPANTKILFKTFNSTFSNNTGQYYNFVMSGASTTKISAGGNPRSLLNFTDLKSYCFVNLFYNCNSLTNIDNLILDSTTLTTGCYAYMFAGCSKITSIPNGFLPSITSAPNSCYRGMFQSCTSLTSIPSNLLPATQVGSYSYEAMFKGCTTLPSPPNLPATTLGSNCYGNMFDHCYGITTLPSNLLPATNLEYACYTSMFANCGNLTAIPPNLLTAATVMKQTCYFGMFGGCNSLTSVQLTLPATTLADSCYAAMFNGCANLKHITTLSLPATQLKKYCYKSMFAYCPEIRFFPHITITSVEEGSCQSMFEGCTKIWADIDSIVLNGITNFAKNCFKYMFKGCAVQYVTPGFLGYLDSHKNCTLGESCFEGMFMGCTQLRTGPYLPAITMATSCYTDMFSGCTTLSAVSPLLATTLNTGCYNRMFAGCTNLLSLSANFTTWNTNYTTDWVKNITNNTGVFYGPSGLAVTKGASYIPTNWTKSPQHFAGQVWLDNITNHYYDGNSNRNIIILNENTNTVIDNLYIKQTGDSNVYRLEAPITIQRVTANTFKFLFSPTPTETIGWYTSDMALITGYNTGPFSGDVWKIGQTNLPIAATENYFGIKDINVLLSKWHNQGYSSARIANYTWWKDNHSGGASSSSGTAIPISIDPIHIDLQVQGWTNNAWQNLTDQVSMVCYMNKKHNNPLTLWSTDNDWYFNITNPRNLEFHYQILSSNNVVYEHGTKANPINIKVLKNQYLKLWNHGCGLNTSNLTKLCHFSSTPTNVKIKVSGDFSSLSGFNPFKGDLIEEDFVGFAQPYMYYGLCSGWTALGTISSNTILPPKLTYATTSVVSTYYPTMSSQILSTVPSYYCTNMFKGCTGLSTGGGWDSGLYNNVVLGVHAFESMFSGCTALTSFGSTLSITGVREYSCSKMFMGCTALQNINLGIYSTCNLNVAFSRSNAFSYMFAGCTNLKNNSNGILLFVTNPDYQQYRNMFQGCQSMTVAPNVGEDDGGNFNANTRAYAYMFSGCTSLTNINIDSFGYHTTAAAESYAYMFAQCTNLNFNINYDTVQAYNTMFMSFYDLAYFLPKLQNISISGDAYKYMFYKCLNLTVAPILYSTNTYTNSYQYMFCECQTLSVIVDTGKIASGNSLGSQYTYWLEDASPSGVLHICCTGCDVSVEGIRYYLPSQWAIHFLQ